ncbi:MAG: glutaredoxin domain-containing protein [Thermodesulfobacteriota bacterium]
MSEENNTLTVYGATWCPDARRSRRFLDAHGVQYTWRDVDLDEDAAAFVRQTNHGQIVVPTIRFPDGSILVEPTDEELGRHLGIE